MSGAARIGWVVDVQRDFMAPEGRLYVRNLFDDTDPGAREIAPALARAVCWMRESCRTVVYTGDWHGLEDPEIDPHNPDPGVGTYPPHCMGRSSDPRERAGAEIIEAVRPGDQLVLCHDASPADGREVARRAVATGRPVFVQKTRFNVFDGNPASDAFVDELVGLLPATPEFVVIGVARDVCVTQAVDGLQDRGHAVTAVSDATWGLGLEPEAETLTRWSKRGRVITLSDLLDIPAAR